MSDDPQVRFNEDVRSEWCSFARNALMVTTKTGDLPSVKDMRSACDVADEMIEHYKKRFAPK